MKYLPLYNNLTTEQQQCVVEAVVESYNKVISK